MLNKIEVQILMDVYEMDINNGPRINSLKYDLIEADERERKYEIASYLLKMQRLGYINIEQGAFVTGGNINIKYRNNVLMYFDEKLHITEKGIAYVDEIKKQYLIKQKLKEKIFY